MLTTTIDKRCKYMKLGRLIQYGGHSLEITFASDRFPGFNRLFHQIPWNLYLDNIYQNDQDEGTLNFREKEDLQSITRIHYTLSDLMEFNGRSTPFSEMDDLPDNTQYQKRLSFKSRYFYEKEGMYDEKFNGKFMFKKFNGRFRRFMFNRKID